MHFVFQLIKQLRLLSRQMSFTLVLVGVFMFSQTAALIHSEIHPFHHHTEQCDKFAGVEHQVLDVPSVLVLPQLVFPNERSVIERIHFIIAPFLSGFHARAPPIL